MCRASTPTKESSCIARDGTKPTTLPGRQSRLLEVAHLLSRSSLSYRKVRSWSKMSSSLADVTTTTQVTKKLIPFLRSPVWITTGFGAKFAGPKGTNFDCEHDPILCKAMIDDLCTDSKEQLKQFKEHPELFDKYCRDLEGELNKRFTLVRHRSSTRHFSQSE